MLTTSMWLECGGVAPYSVVAPQAASDTVKSSTALCPELNSKSSAEVVAVNRSDSPSKAISSSYPTL